MLTPYSDILFPEAARLHAGEPFRNNTRFKHIEKHAARRVQMPETVKFKKENLLSPKQSRQTANKRCPKRPKSLTKPLLITSFA
jgi:hypothetical protein